MTAIPDSRWDLEGVRSHFTTKLPLAALLGIEVIAAEPSSARVRLVGSEGIARPGRHDRRSCPLCDGRHGELRAHARASSSRGCPDLKSFDQLLSPRA